MISRSRRAAARWAMLGATAAIAGACGSRTGLDYPPPPPPEPECVVDGDCVGWDDFCNPVACVLAPPGDADAGVAGPLDELVLRCVAQEVNTCDDNDPCTKDVCDPVARSCRYSLATLDSDGDGYRAPRPGFAPGAPESCGDDCDDTNENAHPGGIEICDGVDNDCNGKVDDDATYVPIGNNAVKVSDLEPSGPGGIAWSGTSYAAIYWAESDNFKTFSSMLTPEGQTITPPGETHVTFSNATGVGGPIIWIGDRYGMAWSDRRTGDYEIYFTLLSEAGDKAIADVQLTDAAEFSINTSMAWNGTEFLIVWQDARDAWPLYDLFAQRVDVSGVPIGSNVKLTEVNSGLGNESPSVAIGVNSVGVAWSLGDAAQHSVQFQLFSIDLTTPLTDPIEVAADSQHTQVVYPSVIWNKDRYVVIWSERDNVDDPEPNPIANQRAAYGAAFAEDGAPMVPRKQLTNPGAFRTRYPFAKPLGDRLLLLYSDDRDGDDYEIYSRMIGQNLDPAGLELRITNAAKNSAYPLGAFGPDGDVGVLFRDDRDGFQKIYFTRLGCVVGGGP